MANIGQKWKRAMVIGCSHGHHGQSEAIDTVCSFADRWKPDTRWHLGDFTDQACFRGGAKGTRDETVSIEDDIAAATSLLLKFRATHILNGNHEDRVWHLANHHVQVVSMAAKAAIEQIQRTVRKLKARHYTDYDIGAPAPMLGDTKMLHGWMYGEQAIRDHAEHFGKCIIAHLHRAGSAHGRRDDNPAAYCVGTLASIPSLQYANRNRAKAMWSNGFVFGEYTDTQAVWWVCEANREGKWRLPL